MDGDLSDILRLVGGLAGAGGTPSPPQDPPASAPDFFSEGRILKVLQAAFTSFSAGSKNDERARLLLALRPFLSPGRAQKVDAAITAMRVADVARIAIYGEEVDRG
ncbi:MAG: hypothetical protein IKT60_00550 [Clostridia bacterium]|nr:hypothetical protein [Clostridia bacterium]